MGSSKGRSLEVCRKFMETLLWNLLESKDGVLTHTELCERCDGIVHHKDSVRYLRELWVVCCENGCPNLSLMVVSQGERVPGKWYYELYEASHPVTFYYGRERFKAEMVFRLGGMAEGLRRWYLVVERRKCLDCCIELE
ncbi:hypothetical protein [Turicibacter sanguinis]|uniref:hypothetical protein n=1 Tax=Turicibacter sanguinis TaxID=154288 RepID=UPI0018A8EFB2|nr:hypothetical protein [Turicibacter sanguinis]MDB8559595.1 hypothetical protein [Turicibacter sanguinis]MDB8561048.1 hypothetical protein [Turicibacter sanguinis]